MSKQRILSIEYIRGIAMLGVVSIHTGAYSLANPQVNVHLFALLEIVSRFSVPIFFFVSAFGLFWSQDLRAAFHYKQYIRRRAQTVLLPYLTWSFLYLIHSTVISRDFSVWYPVALIQTLFFGLASYQLYFLIILLWFYLLMPLWRHLLRIILGQPHIYLPLLLLFQIVFDYYSSYLITVSSPRSFGGQLIEYRLNYWVLHYVFIFLLGGYCAQNFNNFAAWVTRHKQLLGLFFLTSLGAMLSFYYYLLYSLHYTPEQAVNTAHQLSPFGILYTLAASLFLFMWFQTYSLPPLLAKLLRALSDHSYLVYLVHPFFMYYVARGIDQFNFLFTAAATLFFYTAVVILSLTFASLINHYHKTYPTISLLLTGNRK